MGMFFFHIAAHYQISERYAGIYGKAGGKAGKAAGYEAWALGVAASGICGTLDRVNAMRVWEFVEVLEYIVKQGQE